MARIVPSVVLCCIVFDALPVEAADDVTPQEQAYNDLRRVTTNIQKNRAGDVHLVRFSRPNVTDEHLEKLKLFDKLDYLAVVCPNVTDAGLAHLAGLTSLRSLMLTETTLTDGAMAHLLGLSQLERLYLDGNRITDAGLKHLSSLSSLKTLSLRNTRITDAGLAHLAKLENLESLDLSGTEITDAGLERLAAVPTLKLLSLTKTSVAGPGLVHLQQMKSLVHLNLAETKLNDDCIETLAELSQLKNLLLYRTGFSANGLRELREQLPKTAVAARIPRVTDSDPPAVALRPDSSTEPNSSNTAVVSPARLRFSRPDEVPDFQRHVIPLLGRLGCNGRSCHGSFQGQGGFRLSMFGYDFDMDHDNLTGGESPRVNVENPDESLILIKPTSESEDDHGGGQRFQKGGWEHRLLRRWISAGAKSVPPNAARFERLEVTPAEIVFHKAGDTAQLEVVAVWSDGTREDVTCLTRFQSNDESVAQVTADGLITAKGAGDTYVIAFYDNGVFSTQVLQPVSPLNGDRFPTVPTPTRIDELVVDKLSKLGIVPSELSTDEEFLRRVSLDMIGTLPTPEEVRDFVGDESADKRTRKIDELLERPAYVTWWTNRLCDLTGSNGGYLGSTDMAQPTAQQWRDWIERRVRDNVGWDKIATGIIAATSRKPGQTYEEYIAEQSAFTRRQDAADFTALDNPMPHYWARGNVNQPAEKALSVGYTFLGVRLQCAQCHKHPYDQWSKQDFEQFTEIFTRVKFGTAPDATEPYKQQAERLAVPGLLNTAALRRQSYMRIAAEGRPIPWREVYIEALPHGKTQTAKLLGGGEVDLSQYADPREPLMDWLLDENNGYFARAFVNRMWANYFHTGIVEPADDLNLANPPSNKPLLEYLEREFIARGYDIKWLHREIANSRTYQLSWQPNDTNRRDERNFSRAVIRRLPAEVAVDAILQATAGDAQLAATQTNVNNRKIGQHPKSYQARSIDYSLLVFGKPLRTTNCDCERQNEPTLLQALFVRNDRDVLEALERRDGWLAQLAKTFGQPLVSETTGKPILAAKNDSGTHIEPEQTAELVEAAYLRTLGRTPTNEELQDTREHILQSENTIEGLRDMMWALLNSQEFITNH